MRPGLFLAALILFSTEASSQTRVELKDVKNHPFAVPCPADSRLQLHLRSGNFRIVGSKENRVSVRLEGQNADNAQDLAVRFKQSGNDADLKIWGGPKNGLEVTIEVPASSMLYVRMPARQPGAGGSVGR